jgi:hypothetical protein
MNKIKIKKNPKKPRISHHFTSTSIAIIRKTENMTSGIGVGKPKASSQFWWQCELKQLL